MAERKTLARPYAEAVFKIAQERQQLPLWSEMLKLSATVAANSDVLDFVSNPEVAHEKIAGVFIEVCQGGLDADGENLIRLLAENDRLTLLPEIAEIYDQLKSEVEGRVEAEVFSAFELDKGETEAIRKALEAKLGREVEINVSVDKALMGGVVIRAGDLVIDGSVKAYLAGLSSQLNG